MLNRIKILPVFLLFFLAGCFARLPALKSRTEFLMGGIPCIVEVSDRETLDLVFKRLRELEGKLSTHIKGSEVSLVNKAAGIQQMEISEDTYLVLKEGLWASENFSGFDITIGPLVTLWDIGGLNPRVPSEKEIWSSLKLINYRKLELLPTSAFLPEAGMSVDPGGIAKGYMADEAVRIIRERGIKDALVNLGGNVYVLGKNNQGELWRVGLKDPLKPNDPNAYMGIISLSGRTLVTSGVYERFFEEKGERYHHILDPRTGYPVDNDLLSVTIISNNSMRADALSTGVFILGLDEGIKYIENMPDTEAVFITRDRNVYPTAGVGCSGGIELRITDDSYAVKSK